MPINLPPITIPDNIIINADSDNCNQTWPIIPDTGVLKSTLLNGEDLNIKYCKDRYRYLGDVLQNQNELCPDLCGAGEYFDCVSGTCKTYSSYTITPIRTGGETIEITADSSTQGIIHETYYQEDWHDWDWAKSNANFNIPSHTVTNFADLDTFTQNGDCQLSMGYLNGEWIAKMVTSVPFNCNQNVINYSRDAFFIDAPVGPYTYPNTWNNRSTHYDKFFLKSFIYKVQCTITYNK